MATMRVQPIWKKASQECPREGDIILLKAKGLSCSIGIVGEKVAGGLFEVSIAGTHQVAVVRLDEMIRLANLGSIEEFLTVLSNEA